ncbi:MAG: hypothetical protein ACRCYX_04935 [Dermatophilaceae bacterium]
MALARGWRWRADDAGARMALARGWRWRADVGIVSTVAARPEPGEGRGCRSAANALRADRGACAASVQEGLARSRRQRSEQ